MGKWIAFDLLPPAAPNARGWEPIVRDVAAHELVDLRDKIEKWLKANQTHSTKCWLVHGESEEKRGKLPEQHFPFFNHTNSYIRVKFRSARDAVIFKLYFSEYIFTPVHNPKIRGAIETLLMDALAEEIRKEIDREVMAINTKVAEAVMIPAALMETK